jgi:hypothetical protein
MLNYNPSLVPPTRLEAVALLKACWPLRDRMLNLGSEKLELGDYDLALLMGFQKVILAGLTGDQDILYRSGLSSSDVMELDHLLASYRYDSIPQLNRLEPKTPSARPDRRAKVKSEE